MNCGGVRTFVRAPGNERRSTGFDLQRPSQSEVIGASARMRQNNRKVNRPAPQIRTVCGQMLIVILLVQPVSAVNFYSTRRAYRSWTLATAVRTRVVPDSESSVEKICRYEESMRGRATGWFCVYLQDEALNVSKHDGKQHARRDWRLLDGVSV